MNFREAVEGTPQLGSGAYWAGKQALGNSSKRVRCGSKEDRRFTGSVNLEKVLSKIYPNDRRWDYGLGFRLDDGTEVAFWIEEHPAVTSEVKTVLAKLEWLKRWLQENAQALWQLTRRNPKQAYLWLASKDVHIPKDSPQARLLNQAGLAYPREVIEL